MRLRRCAPVLAALALLAPLASPGVALAPPERERSVIVFGEDPCPQPANENEAIVCARRPEEERYRIPRRIRERQPIETSWASRVEDLDNESRPMRPNSCSVVGSGGFTGCAAAAIRQWHAERRARRAAEAGVP